MSENNREPADHELTDLEQQLGKTMSGYLVRSPKAEDTRKLIQNLQGEFDELNHTSALFQSETYQAATRPSLFKQCLLQLQAYNKTFWLTSAAVFIMLTLMSSTMSYLSLNNLFSLVIPLFLFVGVVYSYKTWNREMRMLESITPFPPALLLLSRLLIVLSLCVIYGLIGTIYLQFTVRSFSGLYFVVDWLAAVFLVSGLLAFVMFWKGLKAGLTASILSWVLWRIMEGWVLREEVLRTQEWFFAEILLLTAGIGLFILAYRKSRIMKAVGTYE